MKEQKTEKVKAVDLKLNDNNPRIIKDEKFKKLVNSIKEFPEMLPLRPIIVDENNVILGGNMRYRACLAAGLTEVYVIKALNLTEEQKREFIIKDNITFGEWDYDALANDWDTGQLSNWALELWDEKKGLNKGLEFEAEGAEDDGTITSNAVAGQDAHVKMVQLFMNVSQYEDFNKKITLLSDKYKTDNVTDTILKCIELSIK